MMRLGRSWAVVALGFFAVVAQTVLFRAFLTAFEGNELGIGAFFASWLAWVAIGAALGRVRWSLGRDAAPRFPLLTLVYLPAMLLQLWLVHDIRAMAGVAGYERFPLLAMVGWSFVVNSPVSVVSGYLFTVACRWGALDTRAPLTPGQVYVRETLGACAGGVVVTALLAAGASGETAFLVAGAVVTAAAAATSRADAHNRPRRWIAAAGLALVLAVAAILGAGGRWSEARHRTTWERVLPRDAYKGTFTTPQAEYSYGERGSQFLVVSSGGVCESLPDTEHASEVLTATLSQTPRARNVLVVGPGSLAICLRLGDLPQIERVTWLHPDPAYATRVMDLAPDPWRLALADIDIPAMDVRAFLRETTDQFDLVVLNLPDTTTLAVNRYATREFYELIRARLSDTGAAAVRVTGAANFMGPELAAMGASTAHTLESVFGVVVIKPGDETWLIASDRAAITENGNELARRWAAITGASDVFPPEAVPTLYPPDRVAFQHEAYAEAGRELGPDAVNTDRHPRALHLALLASLRREGRFPISLTGLRSLGQTAAWWLFTAPLLAYVLLRAVYLLRHGARDDDDAGAAPVFDAKMLVLLTGTASMALTIVLMFFYQAAFGSLFLYVGLATALFMAGALAGSVAAGALAQRWSGAASTGLIACLLAHLVLLAIVGGLPVDAPFSAYVALFALCGLFTGAYFPVAAHRLRAGGVDPASTGAGLELLDHAGGTLGATLTGLVWLPLLSGPATVGIVAALVAANLGSLLLCRAFALRGDGLAAPRRPGDWFDRWQPAFGYIIVGVAAWCILGYHVAEQSEVRNRPGRFADAAHAMAGEMDLTEETGATADGTSYPRFTTAQGGVVLDTGPLVSGVYGYGGPLELAVYIEDGTLRGVRILASNETPSYLEYVQAWLDWLGSADLRVPDDLLQVDALSGATLTCEAVRYTIVRAVDAAGLGSAGDVAAAPRKRDSAPVAFVRLAALLVAALAIRQHPKRWVRRLFLLGIVVLAGVWLNTQYSIQNVAALAAGQVPGTGLGAPLFLLAVVPVAALLFGNVYCGYLCPFGALQELLGDIAPKWLKHDTPKVLWRFTRGAKYVVLLVMIAAFALARDAGVLSPDPLITFFGSARTATAVIIAVVAFALSLFYHRFWCRNLCPAGAFLAMLNGLRLVRRLSPPIQPAKCDLGVQTGRELDCIRCDRCRMEGAEFKREPESTMIAALADRRNGVFVVAVVTLAAVLIAMTVSETRAALESKVVVRTVESTGGAGGVPRDVNPDHIQRLIDQGRLSNHEAAYYRAAPEGGPKPGEGRQQRRRRRGGRGQ